MSEKRQDVPGPLIVGLGGTGRPASSTERALRIALAAAERMGARTICFGGEALNALPHYGEHRVRNAEEVELLDAVRAADGILLASPGYHGGVSGLVKNALDLAGRPSQRRSPLSARPPGGLHHHRLWLAGVRLDAQRATRHRPRASGMEHAIRGCPKRKRGCFTRTDAASIPTLNRSFTQWPPRSSASSRPLSQRQIRGGAQVHLAPGRDIGIRP